MQRNVGSSSTVAALFDRWDIRDMAKIDLADDEHAAVKALVRRTIAEDTFSFSPRLAPLEPALLKRIHHPG
jgi:hypothetical protein